MEFKIKQKKVGKNNPTFIIAEGWINHNGSVKIAKKLVLNAAETGSDAIKFQTFTASDLTSVKSKYYKLFKKLELNENEFGEISDFAKNHNIIFLSTPFSNDAVDIWEKKILQLEGHELFDEINKKLFKIELELMDFAIKNMYNIHPTPQPIFDGPHCPKRTPKDSELDPHKSIAEQFELMRVADSDRFPCFFNFRDHKYKLYLKKLKDD